MKQRKQLREWLIDHLDAVAKAFPTICPCELEEGILITGDNELLFIYGVTYVTNWPEKATPPCREPLNRLLEWGYDEHDLMSSTIWMQLNKDVELDEYVDVRVVDLPDPTRN